MLKFLNYMLYTHGVTWNVSRWNNRGNEIYKTDQSKLKHFEKIVFLNKFYIIFHFILLCVFCRFISKNLLKWFLLIICKEHTLRRSRTLLSRNHPTLSFDYEDKVGRCPVLITFMIRSNCPESYNLFLDSYIFNLQKYLFKIFPDYLFWNHT